MKSQIFLVERDKKGDIIFSLNITGMSIKQVIQYILQMTGRGDLQVKRIEIAPPSFPAN